MIKIKRGLDIPIQGRPEQVIHEAPPARAVALVGFDYHGMKPTMEVAEGDSVRRGQLLFTDKKTAGVRYTAPASGRVSAINRGARRVLQSVVIEVDESGAAPAEGGMSAETARALGAEAVRERLVDSGLWTALRTRPFSKVPATDSSPDAIFVTAVDTHPLAADPAVVIAEQPEAFTLGVDLLAAFGVKVWVCAAPGANIPVASAANVERADFAGPHPAGLPGTHVHFLLGADLHRVAWTIGYQDVIAIGRTFLDGELYTDRVIALSGPQVERPRLLRTRLGADLAALVAGELKAGDNRVISGSVLGGRAVSTATSYLGRYHQQVTVLREGRERELLGWLSPGRRKHSSLNIYLSSFLGGGELPMTTNTNGSERAMVPVGAYEKVMPLDILPTQLLRSLIVGDVETAQALGALELDEEDVALCTYVCPGKYEYGPILRDNLSRIEKEG